MHYGFSDFERTDIKPMLRSGAPWRDLRLSRPQDGLDEWAEQIVHQGKLLDLARARPAEHRQVGLDHALVVEEGDNVFIGFPPEPAALFIVLRPVNDPDAGLGREDFDHWRPLAGMDAPDVRPRALNGWTELQDADIARFRLGLQQELDALARGLARDHGQNAAFGLGVDRLVP